MLRDSEENIKLSHQIHDLVRWRWNENFQENKHFWRSSFSLQLDRHLRRVDQDLSRFTIELEADTAGITEILEQSMG